MAKNNKKIVFLSFSLTLGLGLFFLIFSLSLVQAATVDVSASVSAICGNSIAETGETCDGSDNASNCYNSTCKADCTCPVCGNGTIEAGESCESDTDCSSGYICNANCACQITGAGCFLGGTEITLAGNKSLLIEKIKAGDAVLSYNESKKRLEPAKVLQTFTHQAGRYLLINNQLKATANHPFYVAGGRWLAAGELKIGDKLLNQAGQTVIVFSIKSEVANAAVYNLEVDQNHNYFAEGYLVHNKGECISGSVSCGGWSACVGGAQSRSCSNGCTSWTNTQPCAIAVCGDGTINQPTEECDDNNIVSGDGCSAACQLEIGCGNGVLAAGEECDDDNTISGDCCSAGCKKELVFSNVSEAPAESAATINWWTLCEASQSVLEWGKTLAVNEGSISGLAGKKYSQTISNLNPKTVYYYRITAKVGALQNILSGSFLTLGGAEICDNNIDDDQDGFIDIADPNCSCLAEWECTPADWDQAPCIDSQKTRQCQKINNCWNNEPLPEAVLGCPPCENVVCPPNNEINPLNCSCEPILAVCGNGVCEPPAEDPYNCPADCPVECLSDWQCSAWQPEPCPELKIQRRECFDKNACAAPINEPPSQQSCGEVCPGLSCGGTCQKINIQNCACEEYVPCCGNHICENSETFEQCPADCIKICLPDWTCEGWSECDNGILTRHCLDLNKCNLDIDRPPEERACLGTCEAACSTCQNLDKGNCRCLPQAPCCGNRICETEETNWSCPIDCAVPPQVRLTLTQCLDGIDNDRDGFVDYPADDGCQSPADNSEMTFLEMIQKAGEFIRDKIWDNPQVQAANKKVIAPALIAAVAFSTASTFSFLNFLSYLRFLFTQPVYIIGRRKRYKWGVVYNALTKQPVDLAIIRFYEKTANRLIQSRVTDRLGRYLWLAEPGRYYITVTKPKFNFPTFYLKDKREDVKYLDIYHGEVIEVKESGASVALNIPLDPTEDTRPVRKIIFQHYLRRIQYLVAFSAIPLAVVSFLVSPGLFTFTLLIFHWLLYALFRRLGYEKPPKNWGMIYDQDDRKPLRQAITRIYDKQYHKLLETRLTDSRGRYSFLVNNNLYYLTAEKSGYNPYKSNDIDLINKDREAIVNMDIALAKALVAGGFAPTPPVSAETPAAPAGTIPSASAEPKAGQKTEELSLPEISAIPGAENAGVSRESLENLLKSKEAPPSLPAGGFGEASPPSPLPTTPMTSSDRSGFGEASKISPDKPEVQPEANKEEPVSNASQNKVEEEKKDLPSKEKSIFG